jgi:hypothetical protein
MERIIMISGYNCDVSLMKNSENYTVANEQSGKHKKPRNICFLSPKPLETLPESEYSSHSKYPNMLKTASSGYRHILHILIIFLEILRCANLI